MSHTAINHTCLTVMLAAALCRGAAAQDGATVEIVFGANDISHVNDPSRVVLRGAVRIEHGGTTISADGAVLDAVSGEVFAQGPVVLRDADGRLEATCEELRYDLRKRAGTLRDARIVFFPSLERRGKGRIEVGEVSAAVLAAEEIERREDGSFVARDATITSCEFATPHWRMTARSVVATPGKHIRARGIKIYLGRVPIFCWPRFSAPIGEAARRMKFLLRGGQSNRWGDHATLELGWPVGSGDATSSELNFWGISLGHRAERGWESGLSFEWGGATSDGHLAGNVFSEESTSAADDVERAQLEAARAVTKFKGDVYPLSQSSYLAGQRDQALYGKDMTLAAAPAYDPFLQAGSPRSYVEMAHTTRLDSGWELEAQVHTASDRGVRMEYFEKSAKTGSPGFTFFDVRRRAAGSYLSILSSPRTDEFRTETEYLPEVRWSAPVTSLGGGFVLQAEATAGWLKRSYDELLISEEGAQDYEAFRTRTRLALWRPIRLGPVKLSPYVGTHQAFYDHGTFDDEGFVAGSALYGCALSSRIFGRFDRAGTPYRHVIELSAEYRGVSEPTESPVNVLGFDEDDDLMRTGRVALSVLQKLQTKRRDTAGLDRSIDLAGLLVRAERFTDPAEAAALNNGEDWGRLEAVAFVSPSRRMRITSAGEWSASDGTQLSSESSIAWGDSRSSLVDNLTRNRWRTALYHVSESAPGIDASNELGLSLSVAPAGRWSLDFDARYELEDGDGQTRGWTKQRVRLVRDFHDFELTVGAWSDPQKDDWGFTLGLVPRGFAVNLPRAADIP